MEESKVTGGTRSRRRSRLAKRSMSPGTSQIILMRATRSVSRGRSNRGREIPHCPPPDDQVGIQDPRTPYRRTTSISQNSEEAEVRSTGHGRSHRATGQNSSMERRPTSNMNPKRRYPVHPSSPSPYVKGDPLKEHTEAWRM